jgi:hypothetical protein
VGRFARLHRQVGQGIDGIARGHELAHGRFGIGRLQQRAVGALAHAPHQGVEVGLQPHGDAGFGDARPRLRVHEGAAAGPEHLRPVVQKARDDAALAVPEIGLAIGGEDVVDRHARGCFDLVVRVPERQAETQRQPPSDRGLARAHEADERDRPRAEAAPDGLLDARFARGLRARAH